MLVMKSQLVLSCALAVSLVLVAGALGIDERLFLTKGRELVTKHDVATQLKHFLPQQLPVKERCERYALALAEFEKKDSLNYFKMAEIAIMDKRRAKAEFQRIVWLQLMNLYKSSIESFQKAHKINAAMVDLHGCLKADFGSREAKAIAFLNDKELQKAIKQWKAISKEPAELLAGQKQHSSLRLENLHTDVRQSVARWLTNGDRDIPKLFASVHQQRQAPQTNAEAKATVGDFVPKPWPEVQPRPETWLESEPGHHFEPQYFQPEFQNAEFEPQSGPPPTRHELQQPQPSQGGAPEEAELRWSEDEAHLLNEKMMGLTQTYDSLSPDTPLAETCRVYNKVISGTDQPEQTPAGGQSQDVFVPSQSDRANFLFMLRMVQLSQGAEGLFLDLAYCAQKWEDTDDEVKEYFNSAEYLEALESVKPPKELVESEMVSQPVLEQPSAQPVQGAPTSR